MVERHRQARRDRPGSDARRQRATSQAPVLPGRVGEPERAEGEGPPLGLGARAHGLRDPGTRELQGARGRRRPEGPADRERRAHGAAHRRASARTERDQRGDVPSLHRHERAQGCFREAPRAVRREAPLGDPHGEVARLEPRTAFEAERGAAGRQRQVDVLGTIARERARATPGHVRDRPLLDPDARREGRRPRPAAARAGGAAAPGARGHPRIGAGAEARDVQLTVRVPDEGDGWPRERESTELDAPPEQGPHPERESARVELDERRRPEVGILTDLERVQLDGGPREDGSGDRRELDGTAERLRGAGRDQGLHARGVHRERDRDQRDERQNGDDHEDDHGPLEGALHRVRSSLLRIFPVGFLGSAPRNSIVSGTL